MKTQRPDKHSVNRHYVARLLLEHRIAEFNRSGAAVKRAKQEKVTA